MSRRYQMTRASSKNPKNNRLIQPSTDKIEGVPFAPYRIVVKLFTIPLMEMIMTSGPNASHNCRLKRPTAGRGAVSHTIPHTHLSECKSEA